VDAGEEREERPADEHVVEVGDDEVAAVLLGVAGAAACMTPESRRS